VRRPRPAGRFSPVPSSSFLPFGFDHDLIELITLLD
jgi:hypothetical protein